MKPDPLYDHDNERRLLSMLSDASLMDGVGAAKMLLERQGLTAEDFHHQAHADIFGAAVGMLKRDLPLDSPGLWQNVRNCPAVKNAGGEPWLTALLCSSPMPAAAFPGYAKTVRDLALRRRMYLAARDLMAQAQDLTKEPGAVLSGASGALAAMNRRDEGGRTLIDVARLMVEEMEANATGTREPVLPTGIEALDDIIGGLQPTLTIIGALPGVGKSALLATIARSVAQQGVKVGVFSLEDQAQWLGYRLLSDHSGVNQFILRNKRMGEAQLESVHDGMGQMWSYAGNVLIDDRVGLSPTDVANTARDMVVNRGARAIIVDHLGELRYSGARKDRFDLEVAEGLSELRAIAKQYGVPVVCATHLVRGAEERQHDLRLSDFANSAAVERQARVALGLTRKPGGDEMVVWVLKQTNGQAGVRVALKFYGPAALVSRTGGRVIQSNEQEAA